MKETDASYWINSLGLSPHPEGGFYKSSFHSDVIISDHDSIEHGKSRKLFTSIYFLLRSEDISHFHRLKSDELWYYHGPYQTTAILKTFIMLIIQKN